MQKTYAPLLFLVFSIWAILVFPNLLTHGLFVDGLYYGTIARNWGLEGSGWLDFEVSSSRLSNFRSHLPLAFWMEGGFYALLGDFFWVDRVYSLLMFLGTGYWMYRLWKLLCPQQGFTLPLLFWLMIPSSSWAVQQNILENTLLFFAMGSVYCSLRSIERQSVGAAILAGVLTFMAMLAKGPQGLFPLAAPILYGLIFLRKHWKYSLIHSFSTGLTLGLWLSLPGAWDYMQDYLELQLFGSLAQQATDNWGRWMVLRRLLEELLPLLILQLIGWFALRKNSSKLNFDRSSYFLIAVGLSASLPLMLSNKQIGFYLVPAFAFLAMGLASGWRCAMLKLETWMQQQFWVNFIALCLGSFAFWAMVVNYNKISRDQEKIQAVWSLKSFIPEGANIDISNQLSSDWQLLGYSARYAKFNFLINEESKEAFYFIQAEGEAVAEGYILIEVIKPYQLSKPES